MSRKSLLDEAITKAKEAEDWQLVEWLRMARGGESAARWYTDKLREAHRTERKLLDKNAKLRELVSVLAHCASDSGCDSCPINGGCARVGELDLCETAHERMRKLGVEVDG